MELDVAEKIARYFADDTNVLAVYLFGSQAKGKAKEGSDIDLAILLQEKPAFDYRLQAMSKLASILQEDVDVIVLDQCGLIMQHQVLKYGILLFERDSRKRKAFEILSRKMYLEFLPAHRRYVAKMEERLLREASHG